MTLPDEMEPTQKNSKNMVAPMPTDPPTQKRENNSPVPNATNNQIVTPSPLPDKTNHLVPDTMENDSVVPEATILITPPADDGKKPVRGMFKTKHISIRRSKDPMTFKCSVCDTRTPSLRELNAHFIANH